jgi:hypothetical protein
MELLTIHEKKVLTINWSEMLHCSNRRRIWKFARARRCLVEAGAHPVAGLLATVLLPRRAEILGIV